MKKGPKVNKRSSRLKQSLKLEAEVGDDSEAYNLSEDELEELLEDDELPVPDVVDDEWFDDDMPDDDELDPDDPFSDWPFDDEEFD